VVKVIINRGLDGKFKKITESLEGYGQIYGTKMAEQLVLFSPVDTGTFMDSFYAGSGYGGGLNSSHGKPRNQPYGPYAEAALQRMTSQVSALKGSTSIVFGNYAEHAYEVEYDHGYRPFGKTANMHSQIAREAWAEVKR